VVSHSRSNTALPSAGWSAITQKHISPERWYLPLKDTWFHFAYGMIWLR